MQPRALRNRTNVSAVERERPAIDVLQLLDELRNREGLRLSGELGVDDRGVVAMQPESTRIQLVDRRRLAQREPERIDRRAAISVQPVALDQCLRGGGRLAIGARPRSWQG